jgi:hypothetical protein
MKVYPPLGTLRTMPATAVISLILSAEAKVAGYAYVRFWDKDDCA